jgi:hypothetical protein
MLIRVPEGTMLNCCLPVIGTVWHERRNNRTMTEERKSLFMVRHLMLMRSQKIYVAADLI